MTKHSFSIKTLLLTVIVALSLAIGSNIWAFSSFVTHSTSASATTDTASFKSSQTAVTYSFENESGTYPFIPSTFEKVSNDGSITSPEKAGVINLSSTVYPNYKTSYGLENYAQPTPRDNNNKVFMINASNKYIFAGYQPKSSTKLSANSYYEISVAVYTHPSANASVYLSGDDFNTLEDSQISGINTYGSWRDIKFYISTSHTNSSSVQVQVYIGSRTHLETNSRDSDNYILFDDIQITRLSGDNYSKKVAQRDTDKSRVINLDESIELSSGDAGYIENGDFANKNTNWTQDNTITGTGGSILYSENLNSELALEYTNVTFGTHQPSDSSLKSGVVLSTQGGTVAIISDPITIKQQHIYRIAFWAKGSMDGSTPNFKVSGTTEDDSAEGLTCSGQYTSLVSDAETINGNWGLYEFYVVGNPIADTKVNLTLGITSTSSSNKGYVAISDIRSYLINSQQMTDGTSNNSNAKTIKMYSTANTLDFANYSFNLVTIDTLDKNKTTYPLTPSNWTAGANNKNSGVVNISAKEWDQSSFGGRPSKSNSLTNNSDNDNVLMLNANGNKKVQSFTSETETLSKDGYAKITFQAYSNSNSTAYVTVKNSNDVVIAQMPVNKQSTPTWKEYAIYLHNYFNEQTINVTISLGRDGDSSTISGVAYFDNVKYDNSVTQETFDAVNTNSLTAKFDLTSNALTATQNTNDIQPLMWTMQVSENADNTNINSGIFNYKTYMSHTFIESNPYNPEGNTSEMIMAIQANQPVYAYYSSNLTYSLDASSYYKLTVWVKTTSLTPDTSTSDTDYTDEGELIKHGASIIMKNVDSSFTMINTANSRGENEWKQYTMYIYTTDAISDSKIQLGLGRENMPTQGTAYFANLSFTSLTEDEYKNEILSYDTENLPSNVLLATNVPEDEEDDTKPAGKFDPFAFSTIIIALAVIAAVIGLTIKKVKQNAPKRTKKVSNNYDRLQTLMKDVDRRERKTAINHKLKLLREELDQSQTFLAQEVNDLRKLTESYNTAKEIAKDNPAIELDEPDIKQIQKEIEIQTAKIQQIEEDIEILEIEKERIEKQTKKSIEKRNAIQENKSKKK